MSLILLFVALAVPAIVVVLALPILIVFKRARMKYDSTLRYFVRKDRP